MTDPPASDVPASEVIGPAARPIFSCDQSGAVVLEYAMIAAMVAVIALGAVTLFANSATNVWTGVGQEVGNAIGG